MVKKDLISKLVNWKKFSQGILESQDEDETFSFCKDFGFKAVAIDSAFEKFGRTGDHKLFKLFDEQDLFRLLNPADAWLMREPNLLRMVESDLMVGGKHAADSNQIHSYDMSKNMSMNRGFFDALYVRCDGEKGHRKGRDSNGNTLIPIRVTNPLTSFKCLKLPSGLWALAVFHPGRSKAYAFPCDDATLQFLTRAKL